MNMCDFTHTQYKHSANNLEQIQTQNTAEYSEDSMKKINFIHTKDIQGTHWETLKLQNTKELPPQIGCCTEAGRWCPKHVSKMKTGWS